MGKLDPEPFQRRAYQQATIDLEATGNLLLIYDRIGAPASPKGRKVSF